MIMRVCAVAMLLPLSLGGCAESEARGHPAREVEAASVVAAVVDSAMPIDESLRRFRAGLSEHPRRLSGGTSSRDELVHRFIRAVEASDTAAIRSLTLSRAEFAYLYYPFTPYTRPPLEMEPGLVWFLTQQNSEKGITRVLRRAGGQALGYVGYRCDAEPDRQERNLLWTGCEVELSTAPPQLGAGRLFGSILERDGVFKIVSYSNDL